MTPTWTEEELLQEVMVEPRWAFLPRPDTHVIQREGWLQLVTPSFKQGGLNGVVFSAVEPEEAERAIDEALALYARHGILFRWTLGPGSRPADLADRLARRGLRSHPVRGMYRETSGEGPAAGAHVEEVDERTVTDFSRVMARGWQMDPAPLEAYNRALLADGSRRHRLFLARQDGAPAAAAGLTAFARSIYLVGAVVLPAFRGRGLYRALILARLQWAAERGLRLATTQAREESSAPILEALGFRTLCRFPVFTPG
jgi:GNAT superfamily N-acetyltransferase